MVWHESIERVPSGDEKDLDRERDGLLGTFDELPARVTARSVPLPARQAFLSSLMSLPLVSHTTRRWGDSKDSIFNKRTALLPPPSNVQKKRG
jgi:hypothetical protein